MRPTIGIDGRVLAGTETSGIREYTSMLLEHMLGLDPSIRFVIMTAGRRPLPHALWMDLPNVTVRSVALSGRLLVARTWMTRRPFVDRLLGGVDVMFFPHFLLAATSPGVRRVMTWHDLSYELMPHHLSWRRRVWHRFQMRPRSQARNADALLAVSGATADDLHRCYGIDPDRIHIVPSGIAPDIRRVDPMAAAVWRTAQGLPQRYVLMLGTREPRKNIEGAVRAWCDVRTRTGMDIPLIIAGSRGWLEPDLEMLVPDTDHRKFVRFIGPVSSAERGTLLSGAAALLYPSFMEGFGFPPLEAMACGVPVIAAANSSIAEVCGDAALLVDPYRTTSIADALQAVMSDVALQGRLIAAGYERAALYTWPRTAQRTLEIICGAL